MTPKNSWILKTVISRPSAFIGDIDEVSTIFTNFSNNSAFSVSDKMQMNISTSEVKQDKWPNLHVPDKKAMKKCFDSQLKLKHYKKLRI